MKNRYNNAQRIHAQHTLTPQAFIVFTHLNTAGSITQREALLDHSIQSLSRRITELNDAGFSIIREDKKHPVTGQRYARYSFTPAPARDRRFIFAA